MKNLTEKIMEQIDFNTHAPRIELHLDVESLGLRGMAFCFGGFVRQGGNILGEFALKSEEGLSIAKEDDWLKANVLPHLDDIPSVGTIKDLYEAYWGLYSSLREAVLAEYDLKPWETGKLIQRFRTYWDNGCPVETNFERSVLQWAKAHCGAPDLNGPYMPIEISTVLEVQGYDPDLPRNEAAQKLGISGSKHNPIDDCKQSAAVMDAAMQGSPLLRDYRVK